MTEIAEKIMKENDLQLIRLLGRGSFGATYLVSGKGNMYVMKVPDFSQQTSLLYLKREGQILKHLQGECGYYIICVMKVINKGSDTVAILTKYIPNTLDLFDRITQISMEYKRYASPDEIWNILYRGIEGLNVLHDHNVVHRDIKPENFLVTSDLKKLWYIDFGSACLTTDKACIIKPMLTPQYASPEIFLYEGKYTPEMWKKSDIWSLGITLLDAYSALNSRDILYHIQGEVPMETYRQKIEYITQNEINDRIINNKKYIPVPREKDYVLHSKIMGIIALMLTKNYTKRPSTKELLRYIK